MSLSNEAREVSTLRADNLPMTIVGAGCSTELKQLGCRAIDWPGPARGAWPDTSRLVRGWEQTTVRG